MGGMWLVPSGLQLVEQLLLKSGFSALLEAVRVLFHSIPPGRNKTDVFCKCTAGRLSVGSER